MKYVQSYRERRHWRRSGVCIVNFEHISRHVLVFIFFNLDHVIARWEPYGDFPK